MVYVAIAMLAYTRNECRFYRISVFTGSVCRSQPGAGQRYVPVGTPDRADPRHGGLQQLVSGIGTASARNRSGPCVS